MSIVVESLLPYHQDVLDSLPSGTNEAIDWIKDEAFLATMQFDTIVILAVDYARVGEDRLVAYVALRSEYVPAAKSSPGFCGFVVGRYLARASLDQVTAKELLSVAIERARRWRPRHEVVRWSNPPESLDEVAETTGFSTKVYEDEWLFDLDDEM
jgi:hypothetical protein